MAIPLIGPILGSAAKDLAFIEAKIAERYRLFAHPCLYYVMETLENQVGTLNVYEEVDYESSEKHVTYKAAQQVYLWIMLDPPQRTLDRFGLDTTQEALVMASQLLCRNATILPRTGDRFDFNFWQFQVKTVKEGGWFSDSRMACEWIMTANRVEKRWPA
jgi:hypothetical protein